MRKSLEKVVKLLAEFWRDLKGAMVKHSKTLSYAYMAIGIYGLIYGRNILGCIMLTLWLIFDIMSTVKNEKKLNLLRFLKSSPTMTRRSGGRIEILPDRIPEAVTVLYDLEDLLGKHEN